MGEVCKEVRLMADEHVFSTLVVESIKDNGIIITEEILKVGKDVSGMTIQEIVRVLIELIEPLEKKYGIQRVTLDMADSGGCWTNTWRAVIALFNK